MPFQKAKCLSKTNALKLFGFPACLILYVAISTPRKPNKVLVLGKPTSEGLGSKYAFARTALNPAFRAGFHEWSLSWTESVLHTAKIGDAFGSYTTGFEVTGFACVVEISPPERWGVENSKNERISAESLRLHRALGCNSLVIPGIFGTPKQIAEDSETLNRALKCPFPVVKDPFLIGYHWRRGDVSADAKNERERKRYVPWTKVVSDIDTVLLED